jgi:hypothetical protein
MTVTKEKRRHGMKRGLLLTIMVASFIAASAFGAQRALACDTSYWTVGCQYYAYQEGHTRTQLGLSYFNTTYQTFDTNTYSKVIMTTAGGTWEGSNLETSGTTDFWQTQHTDDKLGCYNPNSATEYVNCREVQGWG